MLVVDAHEDIAWNALVLGREVRNSALETRRAERGSDIPKNDGLCMVGLPEWLVGKAAVVFGTIYVSPARGGRSGAHVYASAEEAHRWGQQQLDYYHRLADEEERVGLVESGADLEAVLETWEHEEHQVGIVPLMEGADPVREPAEAEMWFERGVRLIGLAWNVGTRYAGGNAVPGPLTDLGRELLEVMADLGIVLDVSHLAEEAFYEAVGCFEGRIVATHANPRALVSGARQLSDDMIVRLAERDGVIGIVPVAPFLRSTGPGGRTTLADVAAAIDHVCQVVGDAAHVGLGSDFDGGFGADSTPDELDTVADLQRIGPVLEQMGYDEEHIASILSGNWLRVLRESLPEG